MLTPSINIMYTLNHCDVSGLLKYSVIPGCAYKTLLPLGELISYLIGPLVKICYYFKLSAVYSSCLDYYMYGTIKKLHHNP